MTVVVATVLFGNVVMKRAGVAGYGRHTGRNEKGTFRTLKTSLNALIR